MSVQLHIDKNSSRLAIDKLFMPTFILEMIHSREIESRMIQSQKDFLKVITFYNRLKRLTIIKLGTI